MALIVWDRDDVLIDLMGGWLEQWWKPAHPDCHIAYTDLKANPPHKILSISLQGYLKSLDDFRLSPQAANLDPEPEVLEWFQKYGHHHRHMTLTATSLDTAPASAAWTFRHFGAWIRSFHLVPSSRVGQDIPQYESRKGEYLRNLGVGDVLVEDSISNLEEARRHGMAGVLVPRPWNGGKGSVADALRDLDRLLEQL